MKIAVSSTGSDLNSQVDIRFGRCPYFIIVDVDNNEIKDSQSIENTSALQGGGAGISAAELVANKSVKTVITGNIGPRALQVFRQLGIEVYQGSGKIRDVVKDYIDGKLAKVNEATGLGFMNRRGMGRGFSRKF